jgi:hypothetical protein
VFLCATQFVSKNMYEWLGKCNHMCLWGLNLEVQMHFNIKHILVQVLLRDYLNINNSSHLVFGRVIIVTYLRQNRIKCVKTLKYPIVGHSSIFLYKLNVWIFIFIISFEVYIFSFGNLPSIKFWSQISFVTFFVKYSLTYQLSHKQQSHVTL